MQPTTDEVPRVGRCANDGFTLIEIMIAIMIVSITALIAVPAYQSAIRKTKRAEGRAALMQLMQQQERFYSQSMTYIEFSSLSSGENERRFKWYSGNAPSSSAYEISASACQSETIQTCVKLTAKPGTPQVDSSFTDVECGNLTFTSTGVKSADSKHCW